MRVKETGYKYEACTANGVPVFDVIFCRNEKGSFIDGITNEELVDILIHRMKFLVSQKQSEENMNSLTHLIQVRKWMNLRNSKKIQKIQSRKHNDLRRNGIPVQAEGRQVGQ